MATIDEIYNFLLISPTLATAGQPTAEQFAAIRAAGYEVVINLAPAEPPHALLNEAEIAQANSLEYVHIPVIWTAPSAADLDAFLTAMQHNQTRKCFVHCLANMRVSAFVYLYRILDQQISQDEAAEQLHKLWVPNPIWAQFIANELAKRQLPAT